MVGVENVRSCSEEEMNWLVNGGRNRIERMARRFNREILKGRGDFYISIDLPTDIIIYVESMRSGVGAVYRFDRRQREQAERLYRWFKYHPEVKTVKLTTGKEFFDLDDHSFRISVTWHGDYAYWQGWSYVETVIPENLFPNGI